MTIKPEQFVEAIYSGPTTSDLADALAIRDEIGTWIANTPGISIPVDYAKKAAERLIKADLINVSVAYRRSRDEDEDDENDDLDF